MAEKLHPIEHGGEKAEHVEVHHHREHLSHKEKHEAGERQKHSAEQARESVEKLSITTAEAAAKKEKHQDSEDQDIVLSKSYKSVMNRVESQLPGYQRTFSRFIRQPSVDKVSVLLG